MKTEEFKNITIAYMRNVGEYGSKNKVLMEIFKEFLKTNDLFNYKSVILGIALDDSERVSANKLRYDVGLVIDETNTSSLARRKIDDGTYAIFEVPHTKEGVQNFWESIPKLTANLSVDYERPIIERYAVEKINNHLCEFCIPLKS